MPRFGKSQMEKYSPGRDSSAGHKKEADERDVLILAMSHRTAQGQTDLIGCPCGCNEAPSGKGTTFKMGHDARLRGKLIRAHLTGTKVVEVVDGEERKPVTAMKLANEHEWGEYLKEAVARREGKNREVLQKALNSKRLVKVGRWEHTGQVVAVYNNGDGETYDIEYVTRGGAKKRLEKVPAAQTREVS